MTAWDLDLPARTPPDTRPLIAVVEDNADIRALLDEVLRGANYRTVLCPSARQAAQVLRTAPPHLVIQDYWLEAPEAGEQLLVQLETDPRLQAIPVIVCSARFGQGRGERRQMEARGHAVLAKPFRPAALLALIQEQLGRGGPG